MRCFFAALFGLVDLGSRLVEFFVQSLDGLVEIIGRKHAFLDQCLEHGFLGKLQAADKVGKLGQVFADKGVGEGFRLFLLVAL